MIKNQSILIQDTDFFQDSEDPSVYYYLPSSPVLSPRTLSHDTQPQLMLYAYRGVNNNGGYLTVQTELQVSEQTLEQAAKQLPGATFLPFPVLDGKAIMNVAGQNDSQDISLMGHNTAIFNQSLDQQQTEFLTGALKSPCSVPLAVVYELDFIAARAPSQYTLEAHWDEVQTYISTTYGFDFFFVSAKISHISETLISNKTVKITGTINDDTMQQATEQLTSMLLSVFFKPVFGPVSEGQHDQPAPLGFYFQQVDISQIDSRYLSFNMTQTSVVRLKKQVQGTLASMGCKQIDANRCIETVDLNSPFFTKRQLNVGAGVDFGKNEISYIVITCQYGEDDTNRAQRIINTSSPVASFSWPSIVKDDAMARTISYSYQIFFDSNAVSNNRRPFKVVSQALETDWDYVQVIPSSCYQLLPISIMALATLQWDWYTSVQLALKYDYKVDKQSYTFNQTMALKEDQAQLNMDLFVPAGQSSQFQYQTYYMVKQGLPHYPLKTQWCPDNDSVYIGNAFAHQRQAHLLPEFQWHNLTDVERIVVRLSYPYNGPGSDPLQQSFTFTKDDSQAQTFSADRADTQFNTVSYIQTVYFSGGSSKTEPPQQSDADFIPLYYPKS